MELLATLERFFVGADAVAPLADGDRVLVAFSGGADSTALLWGMARLAERRDVAVTAAHLDHGLDAGSAGRARAAAALAAELGVPLVAERRPVGPLARAGEGVEAAARRVRYGFLDEVRGRLGARYVATAHHLDDQAETVLLRILCGTGLAGLAGIRPRGRSAAGAGASAASTVVRPLLGLPRSALAAAVAAAGLRPVADPTNDDLGRPRNLLRHRLLPALAADDCELPARAARLAAAAGGALRVVEERLTDRLRPVAVAGAAGASGGVGVARRALHDLPAPLLEIALALLHRAAGAPYPAGGAARAELVRQLRAGGRAGCDCGGGWRWSEEGDLLTLRRRRPAAPAFTYTLAAPGELEIPELGLRFRLSQGPIRPWMFRGCRERAGMALPLTPGERVTVRSRRPGDRIRPLGAPGGRRLKEVLIDRRLPRRERDRLPLLCLGAEGAVIAWVPGVTVADRFRLRRGDGEAWVAEIAGR